MPLVKVTSPVDTRFQASKVSSVAGLPLHPARAATPAIPPTPAIVVLTLSQPSLHTAPTRCAATLLSLEPRSAPPARMTDASADLLAIESAVHHRDRTSGAPTGGPLWRGRLARVAQYRRGPRQYIHVVF
jgi:hypothetical protein